MSVTLTKRKLSISSKPTIAEEPKQKELPIDSMVQETIRKVDKIFLDKKFDSISYIIDYLSHDKTSPKRQSTDELLKEQKSLIQQCISPIVDMYYTNFNDSLHILNEIYTDFSGTQERIADLYSYTQKISDIINTKKEGLQELCLQKLKMQYLLEILQTVDKIKNSLTTIETYESQKRYIAAADHLIEIENLLTTSPFCDFRSLNSIKQNIEEKKKALQLQLYDRLFKLVHTDEEEKNDSYANTVYPNEITSDIELLLIENQEYTCAPETIITIYVTALTKLGYCHEVEVNLKNSLYNKLISIYTALVRQEAEKKQENANIFDRLSKEEEKERDRQYFVELTHQILHAFGVIAHRHFLTLENIMKCIPLYAHVASNTVDPDYSYIFISHTIQKAVISYLTKFIQPLGTLSNKTSAPLSTGRTSSLKSHQLSYRFVDSTAWMNNITSREDMKKMSSIYTDVCECSLINIIPVYQFISLFYTRIEDMRKQKDPTEDTASADSEFVNLQDYLTNFVQASLYDSYSDTLMDLLSQMFANSSSFQESGNKLYSNVMNSSVDFYNRFLSVSKQILSLKADYVFLLPALKRFFTGYTSKIDQFLDDHLKNTYSYKRYLWLSQDGYEIYRSELEYIDVENELGSLHQTYSTLSAKHKREKEASLEGDMFNLCVEPAIREGDFITNDMICKCLLVLNSLFWTLQQIEQLIPIKETQKDYKTTVMTELYELKDLYLKLFFILRLEIHTRVYFYIQKMTTEDITITASHMSEAAPPCYMYNLYNDLNVLLSLYNKNMNAIKYKYICTAITDFLPTLLIKSLPRLSITEITPAIITSYMQSTITVQQIFRLYMSPEMALQKVQHLLHYIHLMECSTEEIKAYIYENPREFSSIDLNALFKFDASNRPSDLTAIDWIASTIKKAKKEKKN